MQKVHIVEAMQKSQELHCIDTISKIIQNLKECKDTPEKILSQISYLPQDIREIDFTFRTKKEKWISLMSILIYNFSGIIPLREEIIKGVDIQNKIGKNIYNENRIQIFIIIAYLMTGFKIHIEDHFIQDSNKAKHVVILIERLLGMKEVTISSLLCAHRESSKIEKYALVKHIYRDQAEIAINYQKDLLKLINKKGRIIWAQQNVSTYISSNMYPEMFKHYLISGLDRLTAEISSNYIEMENILNRMSTKEVVCRLTSTDMLTRATLRFLGEMYPNWRSLDLLDEKDYLQNIAKLGMASATRIQNVQTEKQVSVEKKYSRTVDFFYNSSILKPSAKALYETVLYYMWGKLCLKYKIIPIGIDRDHGEHAVAAFMEGSEGKIPLLYCRRNENPHTNSLSGISIRQFWRYNK